MIPRFVKEIFLCILSAILLIVSFPQFNFWPVAWVAFVPLFFAIENKRAIIRFLLAYFVGVLFFLGTVFWLIHVTLAGMIALVLYLALYFGIFGLITSFLHLTPYTLRIFFLSALWVLLEYLRSHLLTGFGWVLLGHSQYLSLPIIQISDITGAYGVSFLVMLVNVGIFLGMRGKELRKTAALIFISLAITFGYGYFRLNQKIEGYKIRISVIQGNIPQELKWREEEKEKILDRHISLSLAARKARPDLIIWPETALPLVLKFDPYILGSVRTFAQATKIPLLIGTMRYENGNYYNSAVLFSNRGYIVQYYDKLHLVPFGEYIPLRRYLRFLEAIVPIGDFTAGKEYAIFEIKNEKLKVKNKFAVLICFEDIFAELSRQFVKRGADFLVNITNDAWFGKTPAAYQHLQSSVFRAVENRLPVVRSANSGVSGFILATGKILSLVEDISGQNIYISGYDTQEITIPKQKKLSFYTRFGDVFVLACLVIVCWGIIKVRFSHGT